MKNTDTKKPSARIFKSKKFARFVRDESIPDGKLVKAITEVEKGLVDADLGTGLIKKRVARQGQGKSAGHRVIIFYQKGTRSFFIHGFSKNDQDDLTEEELKVLKTTAKGLSELTDEQLEKLLEDKDFLEVKTDDKEEKIQK